jgi:hypothetical protein
MRLSLARVVLLFAIACPLSMTAQKPADVSQPKPFGGSKDVPALQFVIPELNFNGNSLGDVVDFLRDVVPHFKVVLVRQGSPEDDPKINVRLKEASLGQFLDVLKMAYPVEITTVAGKLPTDGDVTMIRVIAPAHKEAGEASVRVYHLATIIESLRQHAGASGGDKAATEKAMSEGQKASLNEVLSLVKAALGHVEGAPPALEVHEATQTLIFKGTPEQRAALEDVLDSLDPFRGAAGAVVRARDDTAQREAIERSQKEVQEAKDDTSRRVRDADDRMRELEARNQMLQEQIHKQQAESLQQMREMERLKIRLEAALDKLAAEQAAPRNKEASKKD